MKICFYSKKRIKIHVNLKNIQCVVHTFAFVILYIHDVAHTHKEIKCKSYGSQTGEHIHTTEQERSINF